MTRLYGLKIMFGAIIIGIILIGICYLMVTTSINWLSNILSLVIGCTIGGMVGYCISYKFYKNSTKDLKLTKTQLLLVSNNLKEYSEEILDKSKDINTDVVTLANFLSKIFGTKTFNITSGNKTLQIEINVNDEGNISINEAIKTDNLSNQDFG